MAQKTIVYLEDDLDGIVDDTVSTLRFGLDGVLYEIDLTENNANKLRDSLQLFIDNARRAGGRRNRPSARPPSTGHGITREQGKEIRAWARIEGRKVSDRGRIPQQIVDDFFATQPLTRKA